MFGYSYKIPCDQSRNCVKLSFLAALRIPPVIVHWLTAVLDKVKGRSFILGEKVKKRLWKLLFYSSSVRIIFIFPKEVSNKGQYWRNIHFAPTGWLSLIQFISKREIDNFSHKQPFPNQNDDVAFSENIAKNILKLD